MKDRDPAHKIKGHVVSCGFKVKKVSNGLGVRGHRWGWPWRRRGETWSVRVEPEAKLLWAGIINSPITPWHFRALSERQDIRWPTKLTLCHSRERWLQLSKAPPWCEGCNLKTLPRKAAVKSPWGHTERQSLSWHSTKRKGGEKFPWSRTLDWTFSCTLSGTSKKTGNGS